MILERGEEGKCRGWNWQGTGKDKVLSKAIRVSRQLKAFVTCLTVSALKQRSLEIRAQIRTSKWRRLNLQAKLSERQKVFVFILNLVGKRKKRNRKRDVSWGPLTPMSGPGKSKTLSTLPPPPPPGGFCELSQRGFCFRGLLDFWGLASVCKLNRIYYRDGRQGLLPSNSKWIWWELVALLSNTFPLSLLPHLSLSPSGGFSLLFPSLSICSPSLSLAGAKPDKPP